MPIHYGEPVRNKVLWVNPLVRHPFNLKVGRASPLGVFSIKNSRGLRLKYLPSINSRAFAGVSRSSLLAQPVIYGDAFGNRYLHTGFKGVGLLGTFGVRTYGPLSGQWGIFDRPYALHARDASQAFLKAGIRTSPHLAHIRLYAFPAETFGRRVYVQFERKFEPVLVLRALGCRGRLENVRNPPIVREAKNAVKSELGLERFTNADYARWFAQTLAKNIARMHSRGWTHGFLTPHNITLDARIVDLDSVKGVGSNPHNSRREFEKRRREDVHSALDALQSLLYVLREEDNQHASRAFADYVYNLGSSPEASGNVHEDYVTLFRTMLGPEKKPLPNALFAEGYINSYKSPKRIQAKKRRK